MTVETHLTERVFSPEQELASFTAKLPGVGAVVSFTGIARGETRNGQAVRSLFLEHHPRLTAGSLETIGQATAERFGLAALRIVHRCGAVAPGGAIVFVAAASAHRRAAFEATDYAMDRLKSEAMFWKREEHEAGWTWIEPTEGDARDLARWSA